MPRSSRDKEKCPDCVECQMCSKNRCRLCREDTHRDGSSQLGTCFTHGEYLEWKRKKGLNAACRIRSSNGVPKAV